MNILQFKFACHVVLITQTHSVWYRNDISYFNNRAHLCQNGSPVSREEKPKRRRRIRMRNHSNGRMNILRDKFNFWTWKHLQRTIFFMQDEMQDKIYEIVTPWILVEVYERFGRSYCLYCHDQCVNQNFCEYRKLIIDCLSFILKIEAVFHYETLYIVYQTTRHHAADDNTIFSCRRMHIKYKLLLQAARNIACHTLFYPEDISIKFHRNVWIRRTKPHYITSASSTFLSHGCGNLKFNILLYFTRRKVLHGL
jgi:hypothetical protein